MWLTQQNTKIRSTKKNHTCSSSIRLKPNLLTQIDSASLAVGRTKYSTLSTPRSLSIVVMSALQKPCDTPDEVANYKINHWEIEVSVNSVKLCGWECRSLISKLQSIPIFQNAPSLIFKIYLTFSRSRTNLLTNYVLYLIQVIFWYYPSSKHSSLI